MELPEKWIPVFYTGSIVDSEGKERDWTENDLDELVNHFSGRDNEIQVRVGHPVSSGEPAYGWVSGLERRGKELWAKIKPTDESFVNAVRQGLYRNVSLGINTLKKGLREFSYVDHIAFLGAQSPALQGLPGVKLSSDDTKLTTVTIPFDMAGLTASEGSHFEKGVKDVKKFIQEDTTMTIDEIMANKALSAEVEKHFYNKFQKSAELSEIKDLVTKLRNENKKLQEEAIITEKRIYMHQKLTEYNLKVPSLLEKAILKEDKADIEQIILEMSKGGIKTNHNYSNEKTRADNPVEKDVIRIVNDYGNQGESNESTTNAIMKLVGSAR